ncbi:hypothetical protein WME97_22320 [Sorangium sp. So ce367]|uniref:hypothetical protein n=1 Tax=Sorangium sp. So ce367 TaxID=3133305 RepID=UPI003F6433BE
MPLPRRPKRRPRLPVAKIREGLDAISLGATPPEFQRLRREIRNCRVTDPTVVSHLFLKKHFVDPPVRERIERLFADVGLGELNAFDRGLDWELFEEIYELPSWMYWDFARSEAAISRRLDELEKHPALDALHMAHLLGRGRGRLGHKYLFKRRVQERLGVEVAIDWEHFYDRVTDEGSATLFFEELARRTDAQAFRELLMPLVTEFRLGRAFAVRRGFLPFPALVGDSSELTLTQLGVADVPGERWEGAEKLRAIFASGVPLQSLPEWLTDVPLEIVRFDPELVPTSVWRDVRRRWPAAYEKWVMLDLAPALHRLSQVEGEFLDDVERLYPWERRDLEKNIRLRVRILELREMAPEARRSSDLSDMRRRLREDFERWMSSADREILEASGGLQKGDRGKTVMGAFRAARTALEGRLALRPDRAWGAGGLALLRGASQDAAVPEAVREAARRLLEERSGPGEELIRDAASIVRWVRDEAARLLQRA